LMRWSGLAIRDAVSLEKDKLSPGQAGTGNAHGLGPSRIIMQGLGCVSVVGQKK
jgi:hypothetical protein